MTASKDKTVNYAQLLRTEIRSNRCFEGFTEALSMRCVMRCVLASTETTAALTYLMLDPKLVSWCPFPRLTDFLSIA